MRPADRRLFIAAFLSLFGILAAQSLLETARDALFLTHVPPTRLAWAYLAMAAVTVVMSWISERAAGPNRRRWIPASMVLGAALTAGLSLALGRGNRAAVYVLFLWSGVFSAFAVTQVWIAIADRADISLAKRVYGRLAAGGAAGAVAGAGAASLLSSRFEPPALVMVAAAIAAATALGPGLALWAPRADAPPPVPATAGGSHARVIRDGYVVRLLLATLLATAVSTLLDFSFKEAVAARLPVERLPSFFAGFHLATSVVSLVMQLGGVGIVVRAAGVARAPLAQPLLVLTAVAATALTGGLAALVLLRGLDAALRSGFQRPTLELLQIPLAQPVRRGAKALIDGLGQRGGQALAAGALLIMLRFALGPETRLLVAAALLVAWTLAVLGLGRRYVDLLRTALVDPEPALAACSDDTRAPVDNAGDQAVAVLLDALLVERDAAVRSRILRTLIRVRRARPALALDEDILGRVAVAAVKSAHRYLAWRLFLEDGAARHPARRTTAWRMLHEHLRAQEQTSIDWLFRVLALRYPGDDFPEVLRTLRAGGRRMRAIGRELIDNVLAGPAHRLTLALIADASDRERLAGMTGVQPSRAPTYRRLLEMMQIEEAGGELAALAARHAAELRVAVAPLRAGGPPTLARAGG
jgi:AAA family ATP:ADP antiporter